ncbi:glycosyltransferase [Kineosporia sp. A_224]|uniref:glycosyltransferase n=1 Tax=Kineosporia sp. A_224 TaxID=1962180 RepID=UPI000B4B2F56|nr:glycosyltransferase [Kineosporia sp. A_224]
MRILVLHSRYPGTAPSGENLVVDEEVARLAAAGHDVTLLQRHNADISGWGPLHKATLPLGVVWNEASRRSLARALDRERPDVVHVHNVFPLLSPAVVVACRDAGVPVVRTVHNYRLACAAGTYFRDGRVCHDCADGRVGPALRHGCYRGSRLATAPVAASAVLHRRTWRDLVSAHVFISAAQRDLHAGLRLPPERCFVKHNVVAVPPADLAPAGPREHAVAVVSRLDAAKGAPLVMAAWDAFTARRPASALRLVVVGSGDLAAEVAAWAARSRGVDVRGLLPRAEASRVLAGVRAALVPSAWEETFGLVAVEAMAVGTAAVAPAHGAFPEIVTDGVDGALFPPGDVDALVAVLEDVDDHPSRWEALGEAARATHRARFTPDADAARLVEIYRFAAEHPAVAGTGRRGDVRGTPPPGAHAAARDDRAVRPLS